MKYDCKDVLWLDARGAQVCRGDRYVQRLLHASTTRSSRLRWTPARSCPASPATPSSTLLQKWGVKVSERKLSIDDIEAAAKNGTLQEIFATGTAGGHLPDRLAEL